jgi:protein-tyrosine kinase
MGRVFEAVNRQDKSEPQRNERDPRAAETGTPATASEPETLPDTLTEFELPERIGAPSGPRSSEGVLRPFAPEEPLAEVLLDDPAAAPPRQASARRPSPVNAPPAAPSTARNGGTTPLPESRATKPEPRAPQTQPRAAHPETPTPQSAARNRFAPPPTIKPPVPRVAPLEAARLHPRLVMFTEPRSSGCEHYRTLRTQVFHAAARKLTQVIVLTSAVSGEGKTATALNLALAIAQSREKRVLVIDGDLRRPQIARHMGLSPEADVIDALSGKCTALSAIIRMAGHELYLLPARAAAAHPSELLSSERLPELLTELRGYFDFILVDAPPVLPYADARLLAHQADAVMLVVRAKVAPYSTVERAIESLPANRLLGIVLNDAEAAKDAGYYDQHQQRLFDWRKLFGLGRRKQPNP